MELGYLPESINLDSPDYHFTSRKLEVLVPYSPRPFPCLEIGITTRCNLFCPTCPRTTLQRSWIDRDMTLECFEKVSQVFDRFETIHFRGWGEPLLNPYFPEMVRLAYQSGARLVLTTNGFQMLNLGLLPYFQAIIFRLDYGQASTYERRNPSAKFNRVVFNISRVLHSRDANQSLHPQILILFCKNKYSLRELPNYLETAAKLQPDRVVFYQPDFFARKIDEQGRLPSDIDLGLIEKIDRLIESRAKAAFLDVVNQPVNKARDPNRPCCCDSGKSIFINSCGCVAPCRNSALPVVGRAFTRYVAGQEEIQQKALFGSLLNKPLEGIVESRAYQDFRAACRKGDWSKIKSGCVDSRPDRAGRRLLKKYKASLSKKTQLHPVSSPRDHR